MRVRRQHGVLERHGAQRALLPVLSEGHRRGELPPLQPDHRPAPGALHAAAVGPGELRISDSGGARFWASQGTREAVSPLFRAGIFNFAIVSAPGYECLMWHVFTSFSLTPVTLRFAVCREALGPGFSFAS